MLKIIKEQSKLVLFLSSVLLVGLILSGCDSGSLLNDEYTLTINVEGEGTVKPGVGSHKYNENEIAFLEVSPDNNYEFKEWSGDNGDEVVYDAEDEKYSLLMDANKEVTAHFVDIVTVEVSNSTELLESLEDSTIEKIILTSDIEKSEKDSSTE